MLPSEIQNRQQPFSCTKGFETQGFSSCLGTTLPLVFHFNRCHSQEVLMEPAPHPYPPPTHTHRRHNFGVWKIETEDKLWSWRWLGWGETKKIPPKHPTTGHQRSCCPGIQKRLFCQWNWWCLHCLSWTRSHCFLSRPQDQAGFQCTQLLRGSG